MKEIIVKILRGARRVFKTAGLVGLGLVMNYATTTSVKAQEAGVVIDSVEVGFGDYDKGLGPAASRRGGYVWEIKEDGTVGSKRHT